MKYIDLRSDTVTKPTPEMRQAMAEAEVGDDVFGEDPTVNRLQDRVAEMCGKETALFMASGTMSNQVAIKTHTQPGDEVILEEGSHPYNFESGAPAFLSGVQLHPLRGKRGMITAEQIESDIRPPDDHFPHTQLVLIENTHNRAGGTIFPVDEIRRIRMVALRRDLKMHLDGARLWNASVATGISLEEYCGYFDSISLCFSKGLGAPVGSILVGSKDFIHRAHRFRKTFGGGMRQVGVLAAACLYALDHHIERLREDHQKARYLAEELAKINGLEIDLESVQTNIVIVNIDPSGLTLEEALRGLKEQGVLVLPTGLRKNQLRAVTHLDVTEEEIEQAVGVFRNIFAKK